MGAVRKLYDDQPEYNAAKKMKIPLQSEVAKYMAEKMGWDKDFCRYYGEKFWNHYAAQGWKLANGNAMKDWKAAFCSQWQEPKFEEDRKKLKEKQKVNIQDMPHDEALRYLDTILTMYKNGFKPDRESAYKMYDYLKGRGWFNLPPDALQQARMQAGNNLDHVRLYELKQYLDLMAANNYTFKQWFGDRG